MKSAGLSEGAVVIFCRVAAIIFALAYVKLYTRVLPPAELGTFFYLTTLSFGLNALVLTPYDFYFQARLARASDVLPFRAIWRLTSQIALLAFLLASAACGVLTATGKIGPSDVVGIYLTAMSLYFCLAARGLLNNRGHRLFVSAMLVFEGAARVAFFTVASHFFAPSGRLLLYSAIGALVTEAIILAAFAAKWLPFAPGDSPFEPLPAVIRAGYPLSISAVCNVLQLQAFRILYVWSGMSSTAATYAVVANVGAAGMSAASSVYSQMFLPKIYASHGRYFERYIIYAAIMIAAVAVVGALFGQIIVGLITGQAYVGHAYAMLFGIVVEAGNLLIGAATIVLMFQSATRRLVGINLLAAGVSVAGQAVALRYYPHEAMAIGVPIAISQILIVLALVIGAHAAQKPKPLALSLSDDGQIGKPRD